MGIEIAKYSKIHLNSREKSGEDFFVYDPKRRRNYRYSGKCTSEKIGKETSVLARAMIESAIKDTGHAPLEVNIHVTQVMFSPK